LGGWAGGDGDEGHDAHAESIGEEIKVLEGDRDNAIEPPADPDVGGAEQTG